MLLPKAWDLLFFGILAIGRETLARAFGMVCPVHSLALLALARVVSCTHVLAHCFLVESTIYAIMSYESIEYLVSYPIYTSPSLLRA